MAAADCGEERRSQARPAGRQAQGKEEAAGEEVCEAGEEVYKEGEGGGFGAGVSARGRRKATAGESEGGGLRGSGLRAMWSKRTVR